MKYNFTTVQFLDINGNPRTEQVLENKKIIEKPIQAYKFIADTIYEKATTVDLKEKARAINEGKEVEFTPQELAIVKQLLVTDKVAWFHQPVTDYIDSIKEKPKK